ncbi:hypothetical protein Y032_0236g3214 [Ancylostoma ceylanicum]|uniref:Uncharacterized protein n=1 Tax=Ancylostoma ceylanicum TaxID=53326 RepID=A0A016SEV0_9BILA|nr:hypothetical protein Y032_0236g3214 [Ancylostoma ceylanicum]
MRVPLEPLNLNDPTLMYSCKRVPSEPLKPRVFPSTFSIQGMPSRESPCKASFSPPSQHDRPHPDVLLQRGCSRLFLGKRDPCDILNLKDPALIYSCKGVPSELPKPRGLPETSSRHAVLLDLINSGNAVQEVPLQCGFPSSLST